MKITSCILLLFLFPPISILGQDRLFNYASNSSTEISTEYLNEERIYKLVNGDLSKAKFKKINKTPNSENDWYYFNFTEAIELDNIQLVFANENCLDYELRFDIILVDTILEISIGQIDSIYEIGEKSDHLLLRRKNIYPRGNGLIKTIKINSEQKPKFINYSIPKIDISKKKRTEIIHRLKRISDEESKIERGLWKVRRKYYDKVFIKKLDKYERRRFERALYGQDERGYCYEVERYIEYLNDKRLKAINDECECDLHEEFFARGLPPTKEMKERSFQFLGHKISYSEDTTEYILKKYLEGGDASAGHAIPHICLMGKDKYINEIDSLQKDSNTFTQIQVIKGLIYFNKPKKGLNIAKNIFEKELESIANDSISIYGYYAWRSLQIMNEYYPNETLPLLLDLYKKYRTLYPNEMNISDHWSLAYNYGIEIGKRVESFQGCDESILTYIKSYLIRYPHLSNNPVLKEFNEYINEKAVHNTW